MNTHSEQSRHLGNDVQSDDGTVVSPVFWIQRSIDLEWEICKPWHRGATFLLWTAYSAKDSCESE